MLATKFTYTITPRDTGGHDVVLIRTADGAEKHFFMACPPMSGITRHMESLTDDCCEGFFPKPRKK